MKKKQIVSGILLGIFLSGLLVWGALTPIRKSVDPVTPPTPPPQKVNGVWVATTNGLDFPSQPNLTAEQLKAEIDTILQDIQSWGMNTVIFQVRPACDALYASDLFPVSSVLSSSYTLPDGFDPLAYIVQAAHERDMKLHAWINPLRVTTGTAEQPSHDLSVLPEASPARQHPEWVVSYADGRMYWDAGHPEVRQLVADGVKEILDRYEVDGIHFDDYFYPYPQEGAAFDDAATYAKYGEGKSLEDWRRDNINAMIRQIHDLVDGYDRDIAFGVSPFAVWKNQASDPLGSATKAGVETYFDLYADTRLWVKEGWLDYICPQIYWSFEQEPAPFDVVFDWWAECVKDTSVDLWVGHAFYKQGTDQPGWDDARQTLRQIEYVAAHAEYDGSIFFRYQHIKSDPIGATTAMMQKTS